MKIEYTCELCPEGEERTATQVVNGYDCCDSCICVRKARSSSGPDNSYRSLCTECGRQYDHHDELCTRSES